MHTEIRALTFDVGGSIFDWQSATRAALRKIAEERDVVVDDRLFCFTWRRRMFERIAEIRQRSRTWQNADEIHRELLDELAREYPSLELSRSDRDNLNQAWHHMDVWEDVPAALERLREHYIVSILTVLSLSIVVDSSKYAGISWDVMLSCEFLGHYKPDPEAYLTACRLLTSHPETTMMVAVHPGDLLAAQRAGLRTAYVKPKLEEAGSRGDTSTFDLHADNYTELANQLCG